MKYYLLIPVILLVALVSCSEEEGKQSIVFVDSVELFEAFDMKKEYDRLLEEDLKNETNLMDSIRILLENETDSMQVYKLRKDYYLTEQLFNGKYEELSARYTTLVTDRLNEYLENYGKEHRLDLMLSGGNGRVLYVGDATDVTDEVIAYVNTAFGK